jgi:hypothetical protein
LLLSYYNSWLGFCLYVLFIARPVHSPPTYLFHLLYLARLDLAASSSPFGGCIATSRPIGRYPRHSTFRVPFAKTKTSRLVLYTCTASLQVDKPRVGLLTDGLMTTTMRALLLSRHYRCLDFLILVTLLATKHESLRLASRI